MTSIATRDHVAEVCTTIASHEFGQKIAQALPANVTLDRFTRVTLTAIQQNPELITADRGSLYNSVVRCAQDGLLPDGREAALVLFKVKGEQKCQYLPMLGGYRKIAAKHGITIAADVVCVNDQFSWSKVPPRLDHTYDPFEARGDIKGAYAVAFDQAGGFVATPVVMGLEEIAKVRAVSRAGDSEWGPWNKWFERMCCKTVARRLFKELPLGDLDEVSARVREAADDEADLPNMNAGGMTVADANVAASLVAAIPADHLDGPDDTPEPDEVLTPTLDDVTDPPASSSSTFTPPKGPRGGAK